MFNHRWTYLADDDSWPADVAEDAKAMEYVEKTQEYLKNSSLSVQIPAAWDYLPDYYAALPEPLGNLQRTLKPKSYPQLLGHLVNHLDWYVNPKGNLSFQEGLAPFSAGIWVVTFLASVMLMYLITSSWDYIVFVVFLFFVPMLVRKSYVNYKKTGDWPSSKNTTPQDTRRSINATLLYRYLRDAYSDDLGEAKLPEISKPTVTTRTPAMTGYPPKRKSPRC